MKISDISVDISPIYPISVMFDTISTSDISDIGDVLHDIDDDRYIANISVLDRYIVEISGLWHTRALV